VLPPDFEVQDYTEFIQRRESLCDRAIEEVEPSQWMSRMGCALTHPAGTAKVAYYAYVVLFSWSVTFGPVA